MKIAIDLFKFQYVSTDTIPWNNFTDNCIDLNSNMFLLIPKKNINYDYPIDKFKFQYVSTDTNTYLVRDKISQLFKFQYVSTDTNTRAHITTVVRAFKFQYVSTDT